MVRIGGYSRRGLELAPPQARRGNVRSRSHRRSGSSGESTWPRRREGLPPCLPRRLPPFPQPRLDAEDLVRRRASAARGLLEGRRPPSRLAPQPGLPEHNRDDAQVAVLPAGLLRGANALDEGPRRLAGLLARLPSTREKLFVPVHQSLLREAPAA